MAVVECSKVAADRKVSSVLSVKNILFLTDFSSTSKAALPYATAICRRFRSTLHLVHLLSDAGMLMMNGGVDYVGMGTIYQHEHDEAKANLNQMDGGALSNHPASQLRSPRV